MSAPVRYERREHVAILRLDRPETRNAITEPDMVAALVSALERADTDPEVRALVLTGNGPAFCSGGNIKRLREEITDSDLPPAGIEAFYREGIQRIPLAFERLEVPVIAAVNGPAIGAGCDLACMCDIRIAAESARFAESFVRLGLIPGDGGAWFLPRVVGMSKACELTFTGDPVDAAEALAIGLVSRVVPDERLLEEALDLARRIAANPPRAVRMAKRLLREGQRLPLASLLELSAAYQAIVQRTEDHREAMAALFEKRPPRFTGR